MKRVLIVDDDQSILEIMTILLQGEGYSVDSASNGDNLKGFLDKSKPDVVLIDIWMPGIHGDVLCNWMKSEVEYKHIPVILLSAANDAQKVAKTVKADACIDKPFDINLLTSTVADFVKN